MFTIVTRIIYKGNSSFINDPVNCVVLYDITTCGPQLVDPLFELSILLVAPVKQMRGPFPQQRNKGRVEKSFFGKLAVSAAANLAIDLMKLDYCRRRELI